MAESEEGLSNAEEPARPGAAWGAQGLVDRVGRRQVALGTLAIAATLAVAAVVIGGGSPDESGGPDAVAPQTVTVPLPAKALETAAGLVARGRASSELEPCIAVRLSEELSLVDAWSEGGRDDALFAPVIAGCQGDQKASSIASTLGRGSELQRACLADGLAGFGMDEQEILAQGSLDELDGPLAARVNELLAICGLTTTDTAGDVGDEG